MYSTLENILVLSIIDFLFLCTNVILDIHWKGRTSYKNAQVPGAGREDKANCRMKSFTKYYYSIEMKVNKWTENTREGRMRNQYKITE
jgi:hypothetical protein